MTDHPSDPIDVEMTKKLVGKSCPECGKPLEYGEVYTKIGDTKYFSPCLICPTKPKTLADESQHCYRVQLEPINGHYRDGSPRFLI